MAKTVIVKEFKGFGKRPESKEAYITIEIQTPRTLEIDDETFRSDREFFRQNPKRDWYTRSMCSAEKRSYQRLHGVQPKNTYVIKVSQNKRCPWIRTREVVELCTY